MGRIEKTVFISYRRTNFYTALAVYQDLTAHGYDVFFDYQSIDSGNFAKAILENIEARVHFVLVLSSSALERCSQPNDWLRLEIETAMGLKRNIVPLMIEGFDFGSPTTIQSLSGKLSTLNTYNGLRLYSDYFFDAMEKLRTRFLNVAIDDLRSREVSTETRQENETKKTLADEAPQVETQQITAEEWFERGYKYVIEQKNFEEGLRCFSEATKLNPFWSVAYYNTGLALQNLKRYDEAEAAYRKAINLNPYAAGAYSNWGSLLDDLKRYEEAEAAFRKAIELYEVSPSGDTPDFATTYSNLGILLKNWNRYEEAEVAYRKAIELNPDEATAHSNLGILLKNWNRYEEAEAAYRKAIELNPNEVPAYNNLVILLRLTNKIEETIPLLKKIIEIDPRDSNSYLALASIDKQAGRESKEHTEKARQFIPEDDWYNRACLESVCDNFNLAFECLEKAAKLEKFNPSWAWKDPDLQWMRDDPRFAQIVGPKPE